MHKGEIGRRIRAVRKDRKLSLRQVASSANLSATHISEIERGRTTPTVGALVRIADALDCETHFFLEPEWLPEVSIVRDGGLRASQPPIHSRAAGVEKLSTGIPGGRLNCLRFSFKPGVTTGSPLETRGEMAGYVVSGSLELRTNDETLVISKGDSFHLRADLPHRFSNPGKTTAEVILVTTNTHE